MQEYLILFHHGCTDGAMGAAVAYHYFKDIEDAYVTYKPLKYGDTYDENVKDIIVMCIDVIPTVKENLKSISENCKELIILDHHEPNFYMLDDIKISRKSILTNNLSGASIAWVYFFGGITPLIVTYIQERDLWKFRHPKSSAFCIGFYKEEPLNYEHYEQFLTWDEEGLDYYYNLGLKIKEQIEIKCLNLKNTKSEYYTYNEKTILCVQDRTVISEFGDYIFKNSDINFVCCYGYNNGEYLYSLRSREGFNASEIAKDFGGGGHICSSGFRSSKHPREIFNLISE